MDVLKVLKKLYLCFFPKKKYDLGFVSDIDEVSNIVYKELKNSDKPSMIARFGTFELETVVNYLGVVKNNRNFIKYIKGEVGQWWWNQNLLQHMKNNASFFAVS